MNMKNNHFNPQGEKHKEGHCCSLHLLSTANCRLTIYTLLEFEGGETINLHECKYTPDVTF